MRFSKIFALLSLTVVAIAMPNANPNNPSTKPAFTCDASVGGQQACCANTQQVSKHQADVLPKLFSALHSPGGLLNGLLQTLFLLLQVPVNVNVGVQCSVDLVNVVNCKQQATCCNFGKQVTQGNQQSFISLLSNNNIAVCGVQAV